MNDGPDEITGISLARASLILKLRQLGIVDTPILRAFETVPHEIFVPEDFAEFAYREGSLPIECGQSITSPTILAAMLSVLEPSGCAKALEVGTGTGYSAALLSRMVKRVFSIEHHKLLAKQAAVRWMTAGTGNIVGFTQNGLEGLPAHQPYDRILLNGSVEDIPQRLLQQLADGGVLVAAVGLADGRQTIIRAERADDDYLITEHGSLRLAPLINTISRGI